MRLLSEPESAEQRPEINLTPLVDVALVLVIIFLATATLSTPAGIRILSAGKSPAATVEPVRVELLGSGEVYVGGMRISSTALPSVLTGAIASNGDGVRVVVFPGVLHEQAVAILELSKRCGASSVILDSSPSLRGVRPQAPGART